MGVGRPPRTATAGIGATVLTASQIRERVAELGERISRDYDGRQLVVVGVLTGAAVFLADLLRCIVIPVEVDFVAVASYGSETRTSGEVRLLKDLSHPIAGKHLLIAEDIIDTGLTLRYLHDAFSARGPASVSSCVLLDKPTRRLADVDVAYRGFEIPDRFVVGYGLDHSGYYRNLPYIAELRLNR